MIYLYLFISFIAGFFFAIFAGSFIAYIKYYELNRKHSKTDN